VRIGRIRTRAGFAELASRGRRSRRGVVRVTAVLSDAAGVPSVAFAIGRPVGTAVVRNRVRRRLRAAIAELEPRPGLYLVGVTPQGASASYATLRSDLRDALVDVDALEAAP
jgi:ribonuclease P protein component